MGSTNPGNSGILSGVFSFVSREFESFIVKATGSEPSTSRVLLDDSIGSDFSREASPVEKDTPSLNRSTRKAEPFQSDPSAKIEREAKNSRRKRIKKVVASSEEDDMPSERSRRSPKSQLSRSLKRRPSMSMPGSLFPRSPSMEADADPSTVEKGQRVRFAQIPDPQSLQRHIALSSRPLDRSASTSGPTRRRPQIASSVKTAVDKFHIGQDDADPSILLPSPKRSPHALVASQNLQYRTISNSSSPSATATRYKRRNPSVESFSDDSGDISGFLRVKGKEKELIAARQELYENERRHNEIPVLSVEQAERDRRLDKVRIKMLEEEIERLKQELSTRPAPTPFVTANGPPPPPPPPPPPLCKKILFSIPATTSESHLFASARASLKQAPPPVENSINPLIGRRAGQPTIGLAADKMAAFLNEMKTVRLRKVSERSSGKNPTPPPSEGLSAQPVLRRSSSQRSQSAISLLTSIKASNMDTSSARSEPENRMGEKRKRITINIHDDPDPPPKRRLRTTSMDPTLADLDSSSTALTEDTILTSSSSRSYPPHPKTTNSSRTWQPGSIPEAPTPSLCSDNDIEREDVSLDDQPPSTPPALAGPSRNVYRFKGNGIPVGHESGRHVLVGMDKTSYHTQGGRNSESSFLEVRSQHPRPNIFDKRLPSSPFPDKSPRRPRPPSRISRPARQLPPPSQQEDYSDEDDPLSLSFSPPDDPTIQRQTTPRSHVKNVAEPSRRSGDVPPPPLSSRSRRWTLDEELRGVLVNNLEDTEDEAVFTGVGTRSKRHGFLAHGGAGGTPVFMGVGYIEGAEGDDVYVTRAEADADDEYLS